MGCSENNNISASQISQGSQGKRGPAGLTGADGKDGAKGPAGPIGPSGENKLDINLQAGSDPFVEITALISQRSSNWDRLAFFIFPGTDVFTPEYAKIAYSIKTPKGESYLFFRIIFIDGGGRTQTVSEATVFGEYANIHVYKILTAALKNLPNTETVLILEGAIGENKNSAIIKKEDSGKYKEEPGGGPRNNNRNNQHRAYAMELR
jgi:hypothetical protein